MLKADAFTISKPFISLFSIVLWGSVKLSSEYFATVEMPFTFIDLPENSALSNPSSEKVSVKLKGQGWQLASLTFGPSQNFTVSTRNEFGSQSIQLRNSMDLNSWLPSNVTIEEFMPDRIEFNIEEKVTKKETNEKEKINKKNINEKEKTGRIPLSIS